MTILANLGLLCIPLAVYAVYWEIDLLFGQRIRLALFPQSYTVWAGTQPAPKIPWSSIFLVLKKLFTTGVDTEVLIDGLLTSAFDVFGYTLQQEPKFFLTAEPQNIQAMLAMQFKDYDTGKLRRNWLGPMLGDSIFTSDGSFWEHSRALFRPQFSRDNINDLEATDKATKDLVDAFGYTDSTGWTAEVTLAPLFYNFTLDTATEFLFGESINSQTSAIHKARGDIATGKEALTASTDFVEAMETINSTLFARTRVGIWYWLVDSFKFRRAIHLVKSWAETYAQMALNSSPQSIKEEGKKTNVLSTLATQCRDQDELRNQTLAILFAGRDTTASLLSWLFAQLSLNPEIYQKLRKIVLADFPAGSTITFAQLKSCRYLQQVLSETLRLHPTVPLNQRVANKNTTLPTGGGPDKNSPIAIRKGTLIGFTVYIMHRRKDLWGEDALEFKPERWDQRVPAWQYLPFSGGPRICLGQQFAITETGYVLVRMLQQFDQIVPVDKEDMAELRKDFGLTMSVRNKVKVRLHKARN